MAYQVETVNFYSDNVMPPVRDIEALYHISRVLASRWTAPVAAEFSSNAAIVVPGTVDITGTDVANIVTATNSFVQWFEGGGRILLFERALRTKPNPTP